MTTFNPSSDARAAAFELLARIVKEWHAEGRTSYSASLKPELRRRTADAFDEHQFDFGSFREFLGAAQDAGVVAIHPAPSGPDVQVVPPGAEPVAPSAPAPGSGKSPYLHVRDDLWKAFVDWDRLYQRFYDTSRDEAFLIPRAGTALEPEDVKRRRAEIAQDSDRFIEIEPVSFEEQVQWMHEFAEGRPRETGVALLTALTSEKPARAFSAAVRARPELGRAWQGFRARKVTEHVKEWIDARGLDISYEAKKEPEPAPAERPSPARTDTVKELRARLHAAIDEMSPAELGAVNIPVRYLVDLSS